MVVVWCVGVVLLGPCRSCCGAVGVGREGVGLVWLVADSFSCRALRLPLVRTSTCTAVVRVSSCKGKTSERPSINVTYSTGLSHELTDGIFCIIVYGRPSLLCSTNNPT